MPRNRNRNFTLRHDDAKALANDVDRALTAIVDDLERMDETRPPVFISGPTLVTWTPASMILIPRVPESGLKLGRLTFVVAGDIAQGDSTNYWTVYISCYRVMNGALTRVDLDEWTTKKFGFEAFDPYVHEIDETLVEGDVLVLNFAAEGDPAPWNGLVVQVEERYGS